MRGLAWACSAATVAQRLTPVAAAASDPADASSQPELVESTRLYGNMYTYAYYFADILVGSPTPQRVSVIVDTGSSLCGFPCANCGHCGVHLDEPFDISLSHTAEYVPCGSSCSGLCTEGHCSYVKTYAEGSSVSGVWFQDLTQLGDMLRPNSPVNATLGCHLDERKLFYTQTVNGIMGLAPRATDEGRPTILNELFHDHKNVGNGSFALCLAQWGGLLTVGGYDASVHSTGAVLQWSPMDLSTGYYRVQPTVISMGGVHLAEGREAFGRTIVDSGTTFTYLPPAVFERLASALEVVCTTSPGCGASPRPEAGPGCWGLEGAGDRPSAFPMVELTLEGGAVHYWPPHAYLYRLGDEATWCRAFEANSESGTVFGISWMLHQDVVFDIQNKRLGVAASACPEHRRAPGEQAVDGSSRANFLWLLVLAAGLLGCGCISLVVLEWLGFTKRCSFSSNTRRYENASDLEAEE